jgi:hypothetical protein
MEQILKNLNDPSWWFTGVFFVVLGILLTKLLFNWIQRCFKQNSGLWKAIFTQIKASNVKSG